MALRLIDSERCDDDDVVYVVRCWYSGKFSSSIPEPNGMPGGANLFPKTSHRFTCVVSSGKTGPFRLT